jgi:hypothetical protein
MVEVEYLGATKTFSPQEISSMVLTKVLLPPLPTQQIFSLCLTISPSR